MQCVVGRKTVLHCIDVMKDSTDILYSVHGILNYKL